MGGFLNKKPWHPGSIQNMEKVAKRESEIKKRHKKNEEVLEDLKKERDRDELIRLSKAPDSRRDTSLDWMYSNNTLAKPSLKHHIDIQNIPKKFKQNDNIPECIYYTKTESTSLQHNNWEKIHNDPLIAIIHQEDTERETIKRNYTLMHHLNEKVSHLNLPIKSTIKKYNMSTKLISKTKIFSKNN